MRHLAIMLAATAAFGAAFASAVSLDGGSRALGAGSGVVASCDADGFQVVYTVSSRRVTDVSVRDIADPTCEGGTLSLTLLGSGARIGGGGPATVAPDGDITANTVSMPIPEQPAAADVDAVHIAVTGP